RGDRLALGQGNDGAIDLGDLEIGATGDVGAAGAFDIDQVADLERVGRPSAGVEGDGAGLGGGVPAEIDPDIAQHLAVAAVVDLVGADIDDVLPFRCRQRHALV